MSEPHHIDERGNARMVDVSQKGQTERRAVAVGRVNLSAHAFKTLMTGKTEKGDVLAAARIAGIMAAKKTSELIPLCHQVALSSVTVELTPEIASNSIRIEAQVKAVDQTGVEMEALTAVTVSGLTIYDMMKSLDRSISIGSIELLEKEGGRSGHYSRKVRVIEKSEPMTDLDEVADESADIDGSSSSRALIRPSSRPPPADPQCRLPPPVPSPESIARSKLVRRLEPDDPELAALLSKDPITSAYMLGDLDMPYAEHCRWYGLNEEGLRGVILLYSGLSMPAVLTKGDPEDVEALIEATHLNLPRRFYCHIRSEHKRALECYFDLYGLKNMIRMGLTKKEYNPTSETDGVAPLTHRDTGDIMKLYQHYPDNFFEPALLDTGMYFGIREEGELLSVAGLHVLSERYDVAAIGNIVTHATHRGQGHASRCIQALLDALFGKVTHVTLNVRRENTAAIACYQKFGFTERYPFVEGWAQVR